MLLSAYIWAPAFKDNNFTWTAHGPDPKTKVGDFYNFEIGNARVPTTTGLPGTGDSVTFQGGMFEGLDQNQDCHGNGSQIVALLVGGTSGGLTYTKTFFLDTGDLIVSGGGTNNFTLQNGAAIDVKGHKLDLRDLAGSNSFTGGSILDSTGGGQFVVESGVASSPNNTSLSVNDSTGAVKINCNVSISGTTNNPSSVTLRGFSNGDLTLADNKGVTVNSGGTLNLTQVNPVGSTNVGGLVRPTDKSSNIVTVNGGTLNRGDGTTGGTWGKQQLQGVLDLKSGNVNVYQGAILFMTGANASNQAVLVEGGTFEFKMGTTDGVLNASGNVNCFNLSAIFEATGGTVLMTVDPQQEDQVLFCKTMKIDSGATLTLKSKDAQAGSRGSVDLLCDLVLAGTLNVDLWGSVNGTPQADFFDLGAGKLTEGGTLKFNLVDGNEPDMTKNFKVFTTTGTITTGFASITDQNNHNYTDNKDGTFQRKD